MPVVTFHAEHLRRLVGSPVPTDQLADALPRLGGELQQRSGDELTMEFFPNRPDLLTSGGAARALRAFLGLRPGMPTYPVQPAATKLTVDPAVAAVRPFAALCFVRGVRLDAKAVQALIDAQEKLTLSAGRRRSKVAIGLHDAAGVKGPFTYTVLGPRDKPFVPLQGDRPMTPEEIVRDHPKGREYGHLVPAGRFPAFLDGKGQVLSLPPIINAQATSLTAATRDVLVDVTGTDARAVRQTVALLAADLAEHGGAIEAVDVHDASGTWSCPDLRPAERRVHEDDVQALLGAPLDGPRIAQCLQRMGHDAQDFGNTVLVRSPAWRFDLLHEVDLVEDVAVGHGFEGLPDALPRAVTFGGRLRHQGLEDRVRRTLAGLGWLEARTLTLSNPADQWGKWGAPEGQAVRLHNPVLEEQTLLRRSVVPSLLNTLAANRHRSLPQRIFEAGAVVEPVQGQWRNRLRLGAVAVDAKAGFAEAKGVAQALARDLGWSVELRATQRPGFIAGRVAALVAQGKEVGHVGELHPDTIVAFGLGAPAWALDVDLEAFLG